MMTILHTVDLKVPPEKAFQALTTQDGLAGWWSKKVEADIRIGGVIHFTFMPVFNPQMKITRLDPPTLVEWQCVGGHEPWADKRFRFAIEARDAEDSLTSACHELGMK